MTDPAVGFLPDQGYGPYDRGTADDIWLKNANGSSHLGLVWPGMPFISRYSRALTPSAQV
jgi:alpha-glucosidase